MRQMKVIQGDDNPIPAEVLAESIAKLGKAVNQWQKSGMKQLALLVLLQHSTKLGMGTVRAVIEAIHDLEKNYCSPKVKKV